MIVACNNCALSGYVWNGFKNIECPKCKGTGVVDRKEQRDLFNRYPDIFNDKAQNLPDPETSED